LHASSPPALLVCFINKLLKGMALAWLMPCSQNQAKILNFP